MEKEKEFILHVEYCTNCDSHSWCTHHNQAKYHQTFIKLKNLIYEEFKQQKQKIKIVFNQVPKHLVSIKQQQNKYYDPVNKKYVFYPNIGSFEVSINGQNIFSKKKDNAWPSFDQILDALTFKIRNQLRVKIPLSKVERIVSSQNDIQFQPNYKKLQQKTLYKQRIQGKQDFSLTNHFKAYHTHGSSTTIANNQKIKNEEFSKQNISPPEQSRVKINVQNIQKLKEALQYKERQQSFYSQAGLVQKNKNKEILINLSSIEQQNTNARFQKIQKIHLSNKSQSNLVSQKSLSRKKLQQWEFDLSTAENQFYKIQSKVKIRQDPKQPNLDLQIHQNSNEQIQTNMNSSIREGLSRKRQNKKSIQSYYNKPLTIFQNLQCSRFRSQEIQEDFINWKSHQKIVQSRKIKQIETYIQADDQYKNQKLRRIYGNWKFQGLYSQHSNSNNAYKLNYNKKGANSSAIQIKKGRNLNLEKNKSGNNQSGNNQSDNSQLKVKDNAISEDDESQNSQQTARPNQNKLPEKAFLHLKQWPKQHKQYYLSNQNKIPYRSTIGNNSKLPINLQNKKQSKSLNKVDSQKHSLNKIQFQRQQFRIEAIKKYIKPKYQNAIQMGKKQLKKRTNVVDKTQVDSNQRPFKQIKSFHIQNQKQKHRKKQQKSKDKKFIEISSNQKSKHKQKENIEYSWENKQILQGKAINISEVQKAKITNQNKLQSKSQNKNKQINQNVSQIISSKILSLAKQQQAEKFNKKQQQCPQQNAETFLPNDQNLQIALKTSRLRLSTNQVNLLFQNNSKMQQDYRPEDYQKKQDYAQQNINSQLIARNQTQKKSKFSQFSAKERLYTKNSPNELIYQQQKSNINQAFIKQGDIPSSQLQKNDQDKYRIDLKKRHQNSQRSSLIRSLSFCQNSKEQMQKNPCKCTLRLQQSHRKKSQSQQRSIVKNNLSEKKYAQTKRRREQLQKERQQYLRKKEEIKHNKTPKNASSFKNKSKTKSYTTNTLLQKQIKLSAPKQIKKISQGRVKIQNKNTRKKKKIQSQKRQHSKTIDSEKHQNSKRKQNQHQTQIQEGWHQIFEQKIVQKSKLGNSKIKNSQKEIQKNKKKQSKQCPSGQNKKKIYYETTGIQTKSLNQVCIQTQLTANIFDYNESMQKDNCYANDSNDETKKKSSYEIQKTKHQTSISKSNRKMTPFINLKIQKNSIIECKMIPQKINIRSHAQITKQIYGQWINKQKLIYEGIVKEEKILGIHDNLIQQAAGQYQLYKSLSMIYDFDLKLFDSKLNLNGFKSNCEENINFMKTVLMLAKRNQLLIVRLFQDYKQNVVQKNGHGYNRLYGVWLCINYRWKMVVVNDCVPVKLLNQTHRYQPIFCQAQNECIWPSILQKAIAISFGGYHNYLQLSCGQIFQALTGSNFIEFKINQDLDKNKQFLKYISENQRKNYIVYCQKNAKNMKEHQQNISQVRVFNLLSKKVVNGQQILFKIQETSSKCQNGVQQSKQIEPYYMRYQKFCESFKTCEILHLRQHHNYCQVQLTNNSTQNSDGSKKFFFVSELCFQQASFGCITISNQFKGNLKSYLYRQQNGDSQLLKLVGQASKTNKKQLFFDCCFQPCKYYLFIQTQHADSTLSYLGQGKPSIVIKQQILQNGLKNNITEYLPVSVGSSNKNNEYQYSKSVQVFGLSRMTKVDKAQSYQNMKASKGFQQLRQKFIELIVQGKNNNF